MSVRGASRAFALALAVVLAGIGMTSSAGAATPSRATLLPRSTAPHVSSISVSSANQDESIAATIQGSNFAGGAKVSLGKGVTIDVKSVTSSTISLELSVSRSAAYGARTLTVTNPGGDKGTLRRALHVDYAPIFEKWAVGQGAIAWQTSLVRPQFFVAPKLSFSGPGVAVERETLGAGGHLSVAFSVAGNAPEGWRTMTIVEGTASWTVPNGLRVRLAPVVRSVAPLSPGAINQTVPIYGSNFEVCKNTEPKVAIAGAGVTVDSVSAALGNLMYAKLTLASNASLGPRNVTVTNCDSGGISTSTGAFKVVGPPTLTSIPPIALGVERPETFRGTNLTWATTFSVTGMDVSFSHLKWLSPTKIRATITVAKHAALGPRDVTASDKGGGSTVNSGVLTIDPLPTELSTSPRGIGGNTAIVLVVNGTGFEPRAKISILYNGRKDPQLRVGPAVFKSSTELEAVVSATHLTTHAAPVVTVTNPDGGEVSTLAFTTDAAPVLHVVPSATTVGALSVTYLRPTGAPTSEAYDLAACTNLAMTAKCAHVNGFKSGQLLKGLVPGTKYFVSVAALASGSYYASRSLVVGPYRATVRLHAPVISKLAASSTTLRISFVGASNGPKAQSYTARACLNAAMTSGCVTHAHYRSAALFTGVHHATYYVRIFAVASPGYLSSYSKIVAT